MTIIYDLGEFWIEHHIIRHTAIATGTGNNIDVNLNRPGQVVGICLSHSITNSVSGWNDWLTQGGGNVPISSLPLTLASFRSRLRNDSGGAITIDVHITVFLRK